MRGTVKSFSPKHGYGFIACNGEEYYFHVKNLERKPVIGEEVHFKAVNTMKGKRAIKVKGVRNDG